MQIPSTGEGQTQGLFRQIHSAHVQDSSTVGQTGRSRRHSVDGVDIVGGQADQIQTLVARLQDVPSSRDEIVAEVRSRLEHGEYATRDAAERTAARILGSEATT